MTTENNSMDETPPTQRVYEVMDDPELSVEEKQRRVLAIGREYLGVTNGYIQRHPSDSTTDEILVSVGEDPELLPEGTTLDREKTYCRHTVGEPSPVAISNAPEQGWQNDPAYEEHDIDCYLGTTMFVRGDVYGTVCFIQPTPREDGFTSEEKMFIELIVRLLGREIEAIQLEQRTKEKEALQEELEKTNKGTLQLASELEKQYQQLFETAVEGIYTTTATLDEYAMANPAFANLLGYESGEELCAAVNSIDDEVFVDPDAYATYSETLMSVGELSQFEYRVRTADGEIRWISDSVTALTDDEGTIEGYRGGVIDITDQKKREQSLVRQQQLNTVLLRVFRHNLRNEFTVIRGYTTMMVDQLDDGSVNGAAIISAIDRVLALAEKSSELDSFLMEGVERKSFDLMALIRQIVADLEGDYPEAAIEVTGPDQLPVSGYPNLKAALRELIENACKHADAPTVTVSVEVNRETIELEISDDGPGLPEQEYKVLETGAEEPLVHGKGLGLWMVYWVVTGHDGDIDTTVSDEGTTITITLSQSTMETKNDDTDEMVSSRQQSGDLFQRIFEETADTLLIVDDNGQTLRANESVTNLIGLPKEEVLGRSFDEFTVDSFDFREISRDDRDSGLQRETATLVRPDGSERIVEYSVTNDIVPGMHLIVCRNITERKEREEELQETKQRLDLALQGTNTGVWEWELGSDEVVWSESMERLFGLEPGSFEGTYEAFEKRVHPDDRQDLQEAVEASVKEDVSVDIEFRIQRADGEQRWVESRAEIYADDDGPGRMIGVSTDITERIEREQDLKRREAYLEQSSDIITVMNPDGTVKFQSEATKQVTGFDPKTVMGSSGFDQLYPDERERVKNLFEDFVKQPGERTSMELRVRTTDDSWRWIGVNGVNRVDDPLIEGLLFSSRDISERKQRERQLREERDFIEQLINTLPDLFYVASVDGSLRRWNERAPEITGYTEAELDGKNALEFFAEEDREQVGEALAETLDSGQASVEARLRMADGDLIPYEFSGGRLTDSDGELSGLVGMGRDITERKERERELEALKERYKTLLDAAPDPVFVADGETGEIIEANAAAETLLRESREDIIGRNQAELHPSDQLERYHQLFEEHVDRGGTRQRLPDGSPIYVETADGEQVPVEISVGTVSLPEGPVTYGIFRDISERIEREEKLAEKTRQLEAIVQNTSEAIYIKDTEGHYQFINESGAELFGHSPEEVIGKHDGDLFDAESAADIRADDKQVMESGEEMSEETVRFIDGEEHVFLDNKYPYRDEDGEIIGMIGISPDISERKQYVRELERRNERFDFASVVPHDLQNPLNVAQGQLQQAQKECESEHLDAVEYAHERMETLINDLLTLSRTGQTIGDLEAVTLEALSEECWENVETKDSEIHTTTDGVIQADRSRLKQLLENLFRNAVEHGGEDVTVTIGDLDSDNGFYVEDDGSGVPESDRDQLFEPGYTTDQSTGLGLNIVKQIAGAHGWEVTVSSGSEGGARFEFTGIEFTDEPYSSSETADDTQAVDSEEPNE